MMSALPSDTKHMKFVCIALTLIILSSCASSSIVSEGPDKYMLYREAGTGFTETGPIKIKAVGEANQYCKKMGKELKIIQTKENERGALGRFPGVEIHFMCLNAGDPELKKID